MIVKSMNILMVLLSLLLLLLFLQFLFHKSSILSLKSLSSLEAGFESLKMMSMLFSSPFIFMGILFVIFDLETLLLIPFFVEKEVFFFLISIMWFVLLFFYLEWKYSGLKWQV